MAFTQADAQAQQRGWQGPLPQPGQAGYYTTLGGYGGYHAPTQAVAAYPVGGGGGGGARAVNAHQPANPYTQAGNGSAGQGAYGLGGGYQAPNPYQSGPLPGGMFGGAGGGYGGYGGGYGYSPQPATGAQGGVAQVGSLIGPPQLPNNPQTLANYPNYQADQTFSQAGGPEYMMRQYGPSAAQGMLPSASTQAIIAPMLADRGVNANLAKQQAAYDLANQNANSLLQWQGLGAASDINQFNNLAGLNNAQQNFLLGQYGNNVGYQNGLLNLYSGMMGNMLSGVGGMAGGLTGGLTGGLNGAANDPNSLPYGLGSNQFALGGNGGYSDPTGILSSIMGGAGSGNPLLAAMLGGATG